jgi:uncharacterized protein YigA (DUF484 family)
MRHRLSQLMDVARDNDRLFDKTRRLILDLLDAGSLEEVVMAVEDSLRQDFQVPFVSLILFGDNAAPVGRWVRQRGAAGHRRPAGGGKTVSGSLREHELDFLFGEEQRKQSAPPPWRPSVPGLHGVLAIGSRDPQHYKSSVGTLFLSYIAEVLGRVCHASPRPCARYADGTPTGGLLRTPAQRAPGVGAHPAGLPSRPGKGHGLLQTEHWQLGGAADPAAAPADRPPAPPGQSSRSLARLLSAVRGLYRYLNREGLCQHDPATGLAPPRRRRLPKVLDTDRACNCSMAAWTTSSPGAIRRSSNCSTPPACACRS